MQIVDPTNHYFVNQKAVSSGDHSFDAKNDGKHIYCFSNEAWSASTKEVSFNVHGIVYVPESEAPSDPLENEGMCPIRLQYPNTFGIRESGKDTGSRYRAPMLMIICDCSETTHGASEPSER